MNFLYHYLGVTARPAALGELRTLAEGYSQGLKGRSLAELLHRDQRFVCREERWGLAAWPGYVALDLETTGLIPEDNRVTEVALVRLWGFSVVAKWSSLVNPGRRIPAYLVRLIGISNEMAATAPPFAQLIPAIREFIGSDVIVAHNASFDKSFIEAELARAGEPSLNNDWVDTLAMAQRLLPHLPNRKLVTVAAHFGIECDGHHRALADAVMAAEIFSKMAALEETLREETDPA